MKELYACSDGRAVVVAAPPDVATSSTGVLCVLTHTIGKEDFCSSTDKSVERGNCHVNSGILSSCMKCKNVFLGIHRNNM